MDLECDPTFAAVWQDMTRILHVINDLQPGGAENSLLTLLQGLHALGVDVEAACLRSDGDVGLALRDAGIAVHVYDRPMPPLFGGPTWLARIVRQQRIDVVHAHLALATDVVALAPLPRDVVRAVTFHNMVYDAHPVDRLRRRMRKAGEGWLLRHRFQWWFGVSHAVSKHYAAHVRVPLPQTLPSPVEFPPSGPKRRDARGALRAVLVGRLSPEKRHDVLFEALRIAGLPHLQVDLVGDGPLRGKLQNLARELGVDGQVRFRGRVERRQLLADLPGYDVALLPSASEGMPLAVIEALGAGLPVVASRVGGIPEVVQDDVNGLLVASGNALELASALRRLASDSGLRQRFGDAARAAAAPFRPDRAARAWADAYAAMHKA